MNIQTTDSGARSRKAHLLPPIAPQASINAAQMHRDRALDGLRMIGRAAAIGTAALIIAVVALSAAEAPAKLRADLAVIEAAQ